MAASLLTAGTVLLVVAPAVVRRWLDARQDVTLAELRRRVELRDRPPLTTAVRIIAPHANEPTRGNGPARRVTLGGPRQRTGARDEE